MRVLIQGEGSWFVGVAVRENAFGWGRVGGGGIRYSMSFA